MGIAFTQAILNLHLTGKIRNILHLLGIRVKMLRGVSSVFLWTEQKILNGSRIFSMSLELNLFDTLDFYNKKSGNIIEQSI